MNLPFKKLVDITDEDLLEVAKIAGIKGDLVITRSGRGMDKDCAEVYDEKTDKKLRLYFNGSNTRITVKGYEVIEYCFDIYFHLYNKGYRWKYKDFKKD